eukprot:CAMPEP_0185747478 /NCGR_PEP_ID=MMETSP1174-20130828/6100_1 /TAXON_ID=35687 /ORGANISM="Dictyocha speculum, Strain CCMP1381" /LENGTH=84 /DNA_ID=CAMNT_0028422665 /DNA_START=38 /DNA_END=288 /DNA_ORIENTATION=+
MRLSLSLMLLSLVTCALAFNPNTQFKDCSPMGLFGELPASVSISKVIVPTVDDGNEVAKSRVIKRVSAQPHKDCSPMGLFGELP